MFFENKSYRMISQFGRSLLGLEYSNKNANTTSTWWIKLPNKSALLLLSLLSNYPENRKNLMEFNMECEIWKNRGIAERVQEDTEDSSSLPSAHKTALPDVVEVQFACPGYSQISCSLNATLACGSGLNGILVPRWWGWATSAQSQISASFFFHYIRCAQIF